MYYQPFIDRVLEFYFAEFSLVGVVITRLERHKSPRIHVIPAEVTQTEGDTTF
jgi:hypothetical protein